MRFLRLSTAIAALAAAAPASAAAWDTIGPVEATYSKSFPGEVTIADRVTSQTKDERGLSPWWGDYCFSKSVKVEAQVKGKPATTISYTGGPNCLNADRGVSSIFDESKNRPPDPAAIQTYGNCGLTGDPAYGIPVGGWYCSFKGYARGFGVEIQDCGGDLDAAFGSRERELGACVSLTAKKKTPAKTVDWRIYYDGQLIGAETVRLSNRYIPGRKGKVEIVWQGTDGFWNYCLRLNRPVYSRNGRLYCSAPVRSPRKAKWEPVIVRVSGPNPGKLGS